uniref:Uncharacterized protein n=1 Tax=Mycena chlorophos TaxID=658473 RepID=A0ABQ0LAT5_MYCCL|nr:predicted protein [Mycena chlorophos]
MEYDLLMRMIYRRACEMLMEPLRRRSHRGEALKFADGVTRTAYPGVNIESMDLEELAAWLAIFNSQALHPCPICLVHKRDLHRLTCTHQWTRRTADSMAEVIRQAPSTSRTARTEYLREFGLHYFQHFLWKFNNSDPYQAVGYDCLHYFDGGIWGRHVWPLLSDYLGNLRVAETFNSHLEQFPRWRDLKHIRGATAISYSEGQTWVDILKCALPCLVEIVPPKSIFVRLVRVMQKLRVMLTLDVTTSTRLEHLENLIRDYEELCEETSEKHDKNFDFLKQHMLPHAPDIFRAKGTSRNMNTRVGEGYQQEVSDLYQETNGKAAEHQIVIHDENEEAIARLKMRVDAWQRSQAEDTDELMDPVNLDSVPHWRLGAPDCHRVSPHRVEMDHTGNQIYRNFDFKLREYLARHYPRLLILICKALYVSYQSCVNWGNERDILRCNAKFHGRPRFDSIIFEANDDATAMGQLELVFRCFISGKGAVDLAMILPYQATSWQPRTRTDCPVRVKNKQPIFVALEHVTRGALLSPIFGASREAFYVIDCIDGDMYLRLNAID